MTLDLNELAELHYNAYQVAAVNRGWHDRSYKTLMWWEVPVENKQAMIDAVHAVEDAVRNDEREKHSSETMQIDLMQITQALNIHSYDPDLTPHQVVQDLVLPAVHKMKKQIFEIQTAVNELKKVTDIS
jgi:hypothetical protein